ISNPPCNDRFDEVTINVTSPIVADAGSDQTITANSTTLSAANPSGNWSLLSGSGNLAEPSNPTTSVTGLGIGVNEFIWTVSNLPCPDSKDTVRITVNPISSPCLDASVTASFLGGASADIQVNYPFNSIISSYSINYGDGSGFTAHTTPGTVGHSFPAPGIYNVCSRFYFLNVIQELDSCEVCDTVLIQPDSPPCGMAQFSATHLGDLDGEALLTTDDYSPFFRYKIDFGDGTLSQDQGNFAQITHTYSGPGTYSVCARLFYTNSFQVLDSCEYCQPLTIPVPFSPCDSFSIQKVSASRSSIFEPISMRGFLYEINDRVHFKQGSLNSVSVKVYDLPADTVQLEGSLTPGSEGNSLDFNLTLYPGQKRICYIGRFTNSQQEADSCVICRDTLLAAPDPCEFFEVKTEKLCANQIGVKVLYSNQSPLEGFTLNFGDGQSYLGVNNGDSINHFYANPGEYIVCGQAEVFGGEGQPPFNPGGDMCLWCDTIQIYANPKVGSNSEICSDTYFQAGNVVPPGATSAWTVLSGGAILDNPTSNDLSASGLSIGVNSFQYGFSVSGCPDLFDTLLITRLAPPTVADAGFDKIVCGNQTNLNAVSPTTGNGLWTLISGSGILAEPSNSSTVVSNLGTGDNQFVWTTSNGICPSSSDTVTITVEPLPTPANAGPDQTVCSDQGQLSGNSPQVGEGVWSVISGGASLVNSGQNNTAVSNLAFGENAFVWSVSVGLCPASTDTIVITRLEPPT
ncbi:MAG TPA: hypothetical protein PKY12_09670, partial [Catalimonadaceae bacterium]|nr:hypothetical protein [Catalimonadaceae bacterium]